jgi:tRNA dimethylallyltransferase
VSFDSVQVYSHLDIGSGKPSISERQRVPHHCIDIVAPDIDFTAGDFVRHSLRCCEDIFSRNRIPLFVGGTGFYIDSLFKGLSAIPDIDPSLREAITADMALRGITAMYEELLEADRDFARSIHPNDRQRVIRGLEVFRGTGKPLSSYYLEKTGYESDDTLYIGLYEDRDILAERIGQRVNRMMERGFLREVENLRSMGYGPELKSMKSIGYAELHGFLDGRKDYDSAIEEIKIETRRYAKRQMTWFRRNKRINWFKNDQKSDIIQLVDNWLNKYKNKDRSL